MGLAYYIVLEKKIESVDIEMDGKRLAQLIKQLDKIAIEFGVKPLSSFISSDPEDAALFAESFDEISEEELNRFQDLPLMKPIMQDRSCKCTLRVGITEL